MFLAQRAGGKQRRKKSLVGRLHVGLERLDGPILHAIHQADIHRDHAIGATAFDDRFDFRDATGTNRVR